MSQLEYRNPTLLDVANRTNPNGQIPAIVEQLTIINGLLKIAPVIECNHGDRNISTIRTGLPDVSWARINKGVQPSKSTSVPHEDTVATMENLFAIDERLLEAQIDKNKFLLSESQAVYQALNNELNNTIFYGRGDVDDFEGLAPRFSSTSAENGSHIILGGGSGADNTSIWLVCWSPEHTHLLYPQGSQAGIKMKRESAMETKQSDGSYMRTEKIRHYWDCGLGVKDWYSVVRTPNIDVSNLDGEATTSGYSGNSANLVSIMRAMVNKVRGHYDDLPGQPTFLMNSTVLDILEAQCENHKNVRLSDQDVGGVKRRSFREVPIVICNSILNTEDLVS
jgi:hypothetical protein